MIVTGILLMLIGLYGYIAAENYEISFEDQLTYIVNGTKPKGYDTMKFFESYGVLIVVLGGILLVVGILMITMKRPRYYKYPIEPDRILNHPLLKQESVSAGPWSCPECGANNASSNVYCSVCGNRKE